MAARSVVPGSHGPVLLKLHGTLALGSQPRAPVGDVAAAASFRIVTKLTRTMHMIDSISNQEMLLCQGSPAQMSRSITSRSSANAGALS